ncbi:MAG: hypothetical protein ACRCW1_00585 [Anaerotignaceae bacterium]
MTMNKEELIKHFMINEGLSFPRAQKKAEKMEKENKELTPEEKQEERVQQSNKALKQFFYAFGITAFIMWAGLFVGSSGGSSYGGTASSSGSSYLQYARGVVMNNLKDPSSYEEINHNINYDSNNSLKSITIEYSAVNSFGARVREVKTIYF